MAAIEGNDEYCDDAGAEVLRRASVLRPLVQAYLNRTGSLESGIRDAVWELGVSKTTVWRWIRRLAEEGGRTSALVPRKRGRPIGTVMVPGDVEAIIDDPSIIRSLTDQPAQIRCMELPVGAWCCPDLIVKLSRSP